LKSFIGIKITILFIFIFGSICAISIPSFAIKAPKKSFDTKTGTVILPLRGSSGKIRKKKKGPSKAQLELGKGIDEIRWNIVTGGPDIVRDKSLTSASSESPKDIAYRFLKEYKVLWGLKNPKKNLSLTRSINTEYCTVLHFQQMHKGIPVDSGFVIDVNSEGCLTSIMGKYYPDIEIDVKPKISAQAAWAVANEHYEKYKNMKKLRRKIGELSACPKLLIYPTGNKDYLLWKFSGADDTWFYYVDADDGIIQGAYTKIYNQYTDATGFVLQPPAVDAAVSVDFRLFLDPNTNRYNFYDDISTNTLYLGTFDANNHSFNVDSNTPNISDDPINNVFVSAHYYLGKSIEFYMDEFGRNGANNRDLPMAIVTNCLWLDANNRPTGDNAYFNGGNAIFMGAGTTYCSNIAGGIDIIAHEFSHGVTRYMDPNDPAYTGLVYAGESGALNESFSDMMGCAVEYWLSDNVNKFENTFEWLIGEDVTIANKIHGKPYGRNMADPNDTMQPCTYPPDPNINDGYWISTKDMANDSGGIHTNCGVPNKMFYLLAEGGTYNNVQVDGIEIENAAQLIYETHKNRWSSHTGLNFSEARDDCIAEAIKKDNTNGTEWRKSIQNAWAAVGVGEKYTDDYEPDNSMTEAKEIEFDVQQTHSISPIGDQDWMLFTLDSTKLVKIETSGPSGDTRMWLKDDVGNTIEYNDDGGSGWFSLITRELDAGTYYIQIDEYGNNNEIATYYIDLTEVELDSYEPDNSSSEANIVASDHRQIHSIVPKDDADWMYIELSCISNIIIETSGPGTWSDTYLRLYDASLNQIAYNDDGGYNLYSRISLTGLVPGVYYIKVHSYGYYYTIDQYNIDLTIRDTYEPDNTFLESKPILIEEIQSHSIIPENDVDYIRFDLPVYSKIPRVTIETNGPTYSDTRMWLFNVAYNQIAYNDDGGQGLYSKIVYTELLPGTYYIKVDEYSNNDQIGLYDIIITVELLGDDFEPDNTYLYATQISFGINQSHSIAPNYDIDWVKFTLPWYQYPPTVTIETSGPKNDDTRIWLYDAALNLIDYDDYDGPGSFSKIVCSGLPAGTYYVKIDEDGNNEEIDLYNIKATVEEAVHEPDNYEPDNTSSTAKRIYIDSTQTHSIVPENDVDWVYFDLPWYPRVPTITIETDGPEDDDTRMWLYDAYMNLIEYDDNGGPGSFSEIEVIGLWAGRYYVKIDEDNNDVEIDEYEIQLDVDY